MRFQVHTGSLGKSRQVGFFLLNPVLISFELSNLEMDEGASDNWRECVEGLALETYLLENQMRKTNCRNKNTDCHLLSTLHGQGLCQAR